MKKRFIACILSGAMVLTAAGCTKQETDPNAGTALEYMEKINSKNLIHLDGSSRLWYTINPVTFADSNKDGIGELKGIIDQLDKISDGDEKTLASDINMNGIYIQNILNKDGSDRVIDYYQLAQAAGTEEDLKHVVQEAANRNMAVMIGLDFAAVSKENEVFKQLYAVS